MLGTCALQHPLLWNELVEKPIVDMSIIEEANEWYRTKVQQQKGKWNILRSCDDNDKMLRERSDRKREEDKVEEDDGCF